MKTTIDYNLILNNAHVFGMHLDRYFLGKRRLVEEENKVEKLMKMKCLLMKW